MSDSVVVAILGFLQTVVFSSAMIILTRHQLSIWSEMKKENRSRNKSTDKEMARLSGSLETAVRYLDAVVKRIDRE